MLTPVGSCFLLSIFQPTALFDRLLLCFGYLGGCLFDLGSHCAFHILFGSFGTTELRGSNEKCESRSGAVATRISGSFEGKWWFLIIFPYGFLGFYDSSLRLFWWQFRFCISQDLVFLQWKGVSTVRWSTSNVAIFSRWWCHRFVWYVYPEHCRNDFHVSRLHVFQNGWQETTN